MKPSIILISLLAIVACQQNSTADNEPAKALSVTQNDNKAPQDKSKKMDNSDLRLTGHIVYQKMEGGFFSFISKDGGKYTPIKLPNEYKRNGLLIEINARPLHDLMTTSQFGTTIEIISVKVLDDSGVSEIDNNKH